MPQSTILCHPSMWLVHYCVADLDEKRRNADLGRVAHRVDSCHAEHPVASSCKRREFCLNGAHHMADGAAWLVDQALLQRPIR